MSAAQKLPSDGHLMSIASSNGCDKNTAEDLVQDFHLLLLEQGYPPRCERTRWSAGVVRNKARRERRSQQRRARRHRLAARVETQESTRDSLERSELLRAVEQALQALSEHERRAIEMRYRDHLTTADIATSLNVPVRTVESRLRRAKARLRVLLAQYAPASRPERQVAVGLPLSLSSMSGQTTRQVRTGFRQLLRLENAIVAASTKISLGCAALLAIGWFARDMAAPLTSSPTPALEQSAKIQPQLDVAAPGPGALATLSARPAQHATHDEIRTLRSQLDESRKELAQIRSAASVRALPTAGLGASIDAEHPLRSVDWRSLATSVSDLARRTQSLLEGTGKPEDRSKVAHLTTTFYAATMAIASDHWPARGSSRTDVLAHPRFIATLIHSTLSFANVPLTAEQSEEIDKSVARAIEENERRLLGHTEQTLALEKLADQADALHLFYRQVDPLLSEEQHAILHPSLVRGLFQADLFCAEALWSANTRRVIGTEESMSAVLATKLIVTVPGISEEAAKRAATPLADEVAQAVKGAGSRSSSSNEYLQSLYNRPRFFVDACIRTYRSIISADLDESIRMRARDSRVVLLPVFISVNDKVK